MAANRIDIIPLVKAYPVVHPDSGEAVCVAAVMADPPRRWVRLFPLDFRALTLTEQFSKYQRISVEVIKAKGDPRPESYTPIAGSIRLGPVITSDKGTWRRRLELIEPLMLRSMCDLQRRQHENGTSLGVFAPAAVIDLLVEETTTEFTASQQAALDQMNLFNRTTNQLERLPWKWRYRYKCHDIGCPTHTQSIVDWELGALYRRVRRAVSTDAEAHAKVRARFLDQFCNPGREPLFIAGNVARWPKSFLVLGVLRPPRGMPRQGTLF